MSTGLKEKKLNMNKSKFGYKDINMEDKADKVNDVFSSVSVSMI